jgi:hypothetical protein
VKRWERDDGDCGGRKCDDETSGKLGEHAKTPARISSHS